MGVLSTSGRLSETVWQQKICLLDKFHPRPSSFLETKGLAKMSRHKEIEKKSFSSCKDKVNW